MWSHLYMESKKVRFVETESRMVVARAAKVRAVGRCQSRAKIPNYMMSKLQCNVYLIPYGCCIHPALLHSWVYWARLNYLCLRREMMKENILNPKISSISKAFWMWGLRVLNVLSIERLREKIAKELSGPTKNTNSFLVEKHELAEQSFIFILANCKFSLNIFLKYMQRDRSKNIN